MRTNSGADVASLLQLLELHSTSFSHMIVSHA